ncbi:ribonuclease HII [Tomitella cavernea]|uniref:Ribonuclease HII n=1 Tax=Tomitella cavernea TaxID=1387982 RepID=A0ABP9CUB8_9ACTN|nr:ribonuclease HII [Tomitella cavernea]
MTGTGRRIAGRDARWPPRTAVRGASGLRAMESALYRAGMGPVAGVDEAGRGACAGPLVVAACILGPRRHAALARLGDSKRLTARTREQLFPMIQRLAVAHAIVFIGPDEVDGSGVHAANIEGMRRAVAGLGQPPGYVLTDGFRVAGMPSASLSVIGGDGASACVAAASVLAKVARDRAMVALDGDVPGYGFAVHKGYATAAHRAALEELGPSRVHRFSYANIASLSARCATGAAVDGSRAAQG